MALIECVECGHEISDQAENCPNCGYPFNEESVKEDKSNLKKIFSSVWIFVKKFVLGILLAFSIFFIISVFVAVITIYGGDEVDSSRKSSDRIEKSMNPTCRKLTKAFSTEEVQEIMNSNGYDLKKDGVWGESTHKAIKNECSNELAKILREEFKQIEMVKKKREKEAATKKTDGTADDRDESKTENQNDIKNSSSADRNSNARTENTQIFNLTKAGAWNHCQNYVTDRLKAPSTAEYPWASEVRFSKVNKSVGVIFGFVDSENSFGAKIRTNFMCKVRKIGDYRYRVEGFSFLDI